MRLFETSNGYIFSFGFDVANQKRDSHIIAWCDPRTKEWEPKPDNRAGSYQLFGIFVKPDHIWEVDGKVIAYQADPCAPRYFQEDIESRKPRMYELTHFGHKVCWLLSVLEKNMERTFKHGHSMYRNKLMEPLEVVIDHE
jgi:hypothetical protein